MKRRPTAKPSKADSIHWIVVRSFNSSGQLNGIVREHYDLWKEMSQIGRLHYLTRKLKSRLAKSCEWTFEDGEPDGIKLPDDETYKPQNFTGPISEIEKPPAPVVKYRSRGPRPRNVLAVGFDAKGKPLCQMTLKQEEWAAMDHDMRLWFISKALKGAVAYYQWRYVD
jgi:hypothetical protein